MARPYRDGRMSTAPSMNSNHDNIFPRPPLEVFNPTRNFVSSSSVVTPPNFATYSRPPPPPFFNVPPPPIFGDNSQVRPPLQMNALPRSGSEQYSFYPGRLPHASSLLHQPVGGNYHGNATSSHNQPCKSIQPTQNFTVNPVGVFPNQYSSAEMMSNQSLVQNANTFPPPVSAVQQSQHPIIRNQTCNILHAASNLSSAGRISTDNSFPPNFHLSHTMMNFPPPPILAQQAQTSNNVQSNASLIPLQPTSHINSVITSISPVTNSEESRLQKLLQKYDDEEKMKRKSKAKITVAEYRASLADAFNTLNELSNCKEELENIIDGNEKTWKNKVKHVVALQDQLCEICEKLSDPKLVESMMLKLQKIKKKRVRKRQQKLNAIIAKEQEKQKRIEKHKEIDRWFDALKEKHEQAKREEEMKKEADSILSEVRRKIYEAKRTVEKLKILEKLRQARRENAVKKGMFLLPKHDRNFEVKISNMKEVMRIQLADYEAEEKALKVMLETEQEGQREEEASWRTKKMEEIQKKKQKNILSCLFGDSDPPPTTSPLYFFWQNYNIANTSTENLVKIRHMWDMYLVSPDSMQGSNIPQQWVVPEPPSNDLWSIFLEKSS